MFTRVNKVPVNSTREFKMSSAVLSRAPCVIGNMHALDHAHNAFLIDSRAPYTTLIGDPSRNDRMTNRRLEELCILELNDELLDLQLRARHAHRSGRCVDERVENPIFVYVILLKPIPVLYNRLHD